MIYLFYIKIQLNHFTLENFHAYVLAKNIRLKNVTWDHLCQKYSEALKITNIAKNIGDSFKICPKTYCLYVVSLHSSSL